MLFIFRIRQIKTKRSFIRKKLVQSHRNFFLFCKFLYYIKIHDPISLVIFIKLKILFVKANVLPY